MTIQKHSYKSEADALKQAQKAFIPAQAWLIKHYEETQQPKKAFPLRLELAMQYVNFQLCAQRLEGKNLSPANKRILQSQFIKVAQCYETGHGVKKSIPDAVYWYRRCAPFEYLALINLAKIYLTALEFKNNKRAPKAGFYLLSRVEHKNDASLIDSTPILELKTQNLKSFWKRLWYSSLFFIKRPSIESCLIDVRV